jgi:hypothetical protein
MAAVFWDYYDELLVDFHHGGDTVTAPHHSGKFYMLTVGHSSKKPELLRQDTTLANRTSEYLELVSLIHTRVTISCPVISIFFTP